MNLPKKKSTLVDCYKERCGNHKMGLSGYLDSPAQKELADEMEAWLEPSKRRDQIIKFLRDEK